MKKWTIKNTETCQYLGRTLHRVVLTEDCQFGWRGDKMGWIERGENLQDDAMVFGDAKVYDDAVVAGNARILGNAYVCGNARVYDDAVVAGDAQVDGRAVVSGNAKIYEKARILGNARVYGNATVAGDAQVYDNAVISGNANVNNNAVICRDAEIYSNKDYIVFKNWWSSGRYFTYLRSIDMYVVGCFQGTGKELINKAYKDSKLSGRNYKKIVKYVESIKKETKDENKIMNFIKWWKETTYKVAYCGGITVLCSFIGIILNDCGIKIMANICLILGLIAMLPFIIEMYKETKEDHRLCKLYHSMSDIHTTSAVVKENLKTEKAEKQSKVHLPKTWEEVEVYTSRLKDDDFIKRYRELNAIAIYINLRYFPADYILRHFTFMKLLLLRDIYKQKDISDGRGLYYIISCEYDRNVRKVAVARSIIFEKKNPILIFDSKKCRDLFFKNFKDMIEECKEFI